MNSLWAEREARSAKRVLLESGVLSERLALRPLRYASQALRLPGAKPSQDYGLDLINEAENLFIFLAL